MSDLRIVFMGTPELAAVSLRALLHAPALRLDGIVTQPDHPKGRGLKLQPSPVKEIALQANLPVLQPAKARDEPFIQELRRLQPDLIVVVAYGHILPRSILDLPRFGCLNVHTSLLPKYRGAAPIQWALLNDEPETGVTVMKLDPGMDTGGILTQVKTPIGPGDNSETLHERLGRLGAELLVKTIPDYVSGRINPHPQPEEGVSQAPKIKKEDGRMEWDQPARSLWNRVRALTPWPGAFTRLAGPQPSALLKIRAAEPIEEQGPPGEVLRADKGGVVVGCGAGSLRILALQREGGRSLNAQAFLAGHPLKAGQHFA